MCIIYIIYIVPRLPFVIFGQHLLGKKLKCSQMLLVTNWHEQTYQIRIADGIIRDHQFHTDME